MRIRVFAGVVAVLLLSAGCQLFKKSQESIKIGVVGPMSYVQGEHHWYGAEMAAEEINAQGGIQVGNQKLKVELVKVDSNEMLNVTDAANAVERAISSDKVDFLTGGFRSEAVLAMQEVAMDHKKIFLGAGASHNELCDRVGKNYDRYKYWFRATPMSSTDVGKALFAMIGSVAATVREKTGVATPKVAILADKAVWVEPIVAAAENVLPKMGMEIVGTWRPSPVASDLTAELSAIKRSGAQIVFIGLSGPAGIVMGRQMSELEIPAIAAGVNIEAQSDKFWDATAQRGNYVITLATFAEVEITPETQAWIAKFKEKFKQYPNYNAGTYGAILVLQAAIEKAGTLDADALVPVLEKTDYTLPAGRVVFTATHDLTWGPGYATGVGMQWQDGKMAGIWPNGWEGLTYKGMLPILLPPWMTAKAK